MDRSNRLTEAYEKMLDGVFSLVEAKQKLLKIKELMPESSEDVVLFARYLSDRLHDEVNAAGFLIGCEISIMELKDGAGIGEKPLDSMYNRFRNMPKDLYIHLRTRIPHIARAVLPEQEVATVLWEFEKSEKQRKSVRAVIDRAYM